MVRILSNGDIVQDDDPRASGGSGSGSSQASQPRQRQGFVQHQNYDQPQGAMGGAGGVSIFDSLNQKLLDAGIPRWNAGPYVVEPIVSLGFVLALVMIGPHGLLFAGLLFFISKYSQSGFNAGQSGGQTGGNRGGTGGSSTGGSGGRPPNGGPPRGGGYTSGGGHRLGR